MMNDKKCYTIERHTHINYNGIEIPEYYSYTPEGRFLDRVEAKNEFEAFVKSNRNLSRFRIKEDFFIRVNKNIFKSFEFYNSILFPGQKSISILYYFVSED